MRNVRQGYLQLNANYVCTSMFFDTTKAIGCENILYTVTRNTVIILRQCFVEYGHLTA